MELQTLVSVIQMVPKHYFGCTLAYTIAFMIPNDPTCPRPLQLSAPYTPVPALQYFLASNTQSMPKSNTIIAAPLQGALIECFLAATRLVRPQLRRQVILVGGAASIVHSSKLKTEDVDIAAPLRALIDIWEGVSAGALNFSFESDGKIASDAPQGFRVRVDIIEIGDGCIERIHVAEPFHEGSVAFMSDLLRLRAVTVVDRGSDGECEDFRWLLLSVARKGQILPVLKQEELEYMRRAGESCLERLDRLLLGAILSNNNYALAMHFIL